MSPRPSRTTTALASLLIAVALTACDTTLETGYKPRPLKASDADRRSYYAPAFSPESHPDKEGGGTDFSLAP